MLNGAERTAPYQKRKCTITRKDEKKKRNEWAHLLYLFLLVGGGHGSFEDLSRHDQQIHFAGTYRRSRTLRITDQRELAFY